MVEEAVMNERDAIFARIREALTISAPKPGRPHGSDHPSPKAVEDVLPVTGKTLEENLELFRRNAAELKADFQLVKGADALAAQVKKLSDTEGWKKVALHQGELTGVATRLLQLPVRLARHGYDVNEMEQCDAGITECDALVAQTGSVLVTSRSTGGRALTVLPPHHVVIARREQVVADLPEAFALVKATYGANYPSMISFITGPSRTGDIERILVLGAHGPKKLTIFCL
jgi:L-lactate dehydrogenase complex protein LldG